jgi:16S rRNA (adenine1518-N6/adenine1519-N6)-dimethyltransferase
VKAPVTPTAIEHVLKANGWRPLHRLGQNFLVQKELLDRIPSMASVTESDLVLEVGPGLGGLTERLLETRARVIAVELDSGYVEFLKTTFAGMRNFQLIAADVMSKKSAIDERVLIALRSAHHDHGWKLVSNLPYQVSSPLLSAVIQLEVPPSLALVMLQKEVASVLTADEKSDDYSPLSFLARIYYQVEIVKKVSAESFHPRPKVTSALVRLIPRSEPIVAARLLLPFIRLLFQSRRKALRGTVTSALRQVGYESASPEQVLDGLSFRGVSGDDRIDGVSAESIASFFHDWMHNFGEKGPAN